MSVIGPRPQLVRDMVFMTDEQRLRHTAKPGLSGLAQVNGRNAISWEDKLEWDLKYIRNISLAEDIKIILATVKKAFIKQEGITQDDMATAEDFGDYLLRNGKIDEKAYGQKQEQAKKILSGEDEIRRELGLVSIIMPSYNTAAYIKESIQSVLNQTWFTNWSGDESILERFDKLPFKNKIIFVNKNYTEYKSSIYLPGFEKKSGVGQIWKTKNIVGKRYIDSVSLHKDKIIISFIGQVRYAQKYMNFLESIKNNEKIVFRFYGFGEDLEYLQQYQKSKGISNIEFYGAYKPEEKKKIIEETDIIFNVYGNDLHVKYAVSNKYYDALVYQKPIIVSKGTTMEKITQGFSYCVTQDKFDCEDLIQWYENLNHENIKRLCASKLNKVKDDMDIFTKRVEKFLQV